MKRCPEWEFYFLLYSIFWVRVLKGMCYAFWRRHWREVFYGLLQKPLASWLKKKDQKSPCLFLHRTQTWCQNCGIKWRKGGQRSYVKGGWVKTLPNSIMEPTYQPYSVDLLTCACVIWINHWMLDLSFCAASQSPNDPAHTRLSRSICTQIPPPTVWHLKMEKQRHPSVSFTLVFNFVLW